MDAFGENYIKRTMASKTVRTMQWRRSKILYNLDRVTRSWLTLKTRGKKEE
jgi:hypothetical protein